MTNAALTVADYEAAGIGDRFRQIMDIVKLFRDFDFTKITELIAGLKRISEAEDLKGQVKAGIDVLAIIAEMTPTDTDDRVVEMIKSVLTDELIDIISRLVGGMRGNTASVQDVTIQAADRQAASAQGIPWGFLVQIALRIIELLDGIGTD